MSLTRRKVYRVTKGKRKWVVVGGDSSKVLRKIKSGTIDSLVTDPPAGISFMGKEWDHDHGGRHGWVKAFASIFKECYRVMKPGAHGLVWAIPRTAHWTMLALEDSGFEIRDVILHHFGTGFPKSMNLSKAIDKKHGKKPKVIGKRTDGRYAYGFSEKAKKALGGLVANEDTTAFSGEMGVITEPATKDAKKWDGWGTALKPAAEHWILVRKPLEGTATDNLLQYGVGGINIDGCRIEGGTRPLRVVEDHGLRRNTYDGGATKRGGSKAIGETTSGRFPSNVIFSHHPSCVQLGTQRIKSQNPSYSSEGKGKKRHIPFGMGSRPVDVGIGYADADGKEAVGVWDCIPGCPIRLLDQQSGFSKSPSGSGSGGGFKSGKYSGSAGKGDYTGDTFTNFGDAGGASRFFYQAKSAKSEKNDGCHHLYWLVDGSKYVRISKSKYRKLLHKNHKREKHNKKPKYLLAHGNIHPTVKSIDLMRYLCRLVSPPGGVVLDPFNGSGSTGVAALKEGMRYVGVEREDMYRIIARKRMASATKKHRIKTPKGLKPLF